MNLPQLKLPESVTVYTYDDYSNGIVPKNGFADTFFKTYAKNQKRIYENAIRNYRNEIRNEISDYYLSIITNEFNKEMRSYIDIELQNYMMENNGIIDSLPYPIISFEIFIKTTVKEYDSIDEEYNTDTFTHGNKSIVYDHFGTECSCNANKLIYGERKYRYKKIICENEYSKILSENSLYEHRINKAKNMPKEKLKGFICNLPAIIGILLSLLLIVSHIFKLENVIQAVGKHIPFYLDVCEVNGYSLIHIVVIIILGLLLSSLLRNIIEPKIDDDIESPKDLQKEYDEFLQKYDLKEIAENSKKYEKEFNRLSEQWHRFWFENTQ